MQVFQVVDDSRRSSRFIALSPLYSLRGLLGVVDVEELALTTAQTIQVLTNDAAA
jgi:hypothetical protein